MQGKFVDLILKRQRFQCQECKATVYEAVPQLNGSHRMTERLFREIGKRAGPEPFARVAADFGLSEGTIKNVFNKRIGTVIAGYRFETPRVIGIDEKHLSKGYRTVIGNILDRTLLDMLPDRRMPTLDAYFAAMPDKEKVQVWCQDMWPPYRMIARKHFPHAQVVVDRFHVVSLATVAMEAVRRRITAQLPKRERLSLKKGRAVLLGRLPPIGTPERAKLDDWFDKWPVLGDAFEAKEGIVALYSCGNAASAQQWYEAWEAQLPSALYKDFARVKTAFKNWNAEIMAYFEHPYTNAYIESVNNLLASIERAGRGYSFEMVRAKALLSHGIHKVPKPKFQRVRVMNQTRTVEQFQMKAAFNLRPLARNLGVDIEMLIEAISTPDGFARLGPRGS